MKAVVWTAYGPPDVLQLQEVEQPAPQDDEVLIRIHAAAVTMGDCEARGLRIPWLIRLPMRLYMGYSKPSRVLTLGMELAGEIESAGKDVQGFRPGDQVFAATGLEFGAYAEYICLPENGALAVKSANMSFAEAAATPVGGLEALHFLRAGGVRSGETVVINGAGGSIGTFAVQIAKALGADVTAVDSTGKLEMLRSIGADHVIDYTQDDFTRNGQSYDVIFDVVGKVPYSQAIKSLKPDGRFLVANPGLAHMLRGPWTRMTSSKKVFTATANHSAEDLVVLRGMIEAGKIKAVIDRRYPLEQAAEAHRYVESGQKKGDVVLIVAHDA